MAIIAYLASTGAVNADFELTFGVEYFDDNDPANTSVGAGNPPGVVLYAESWSFPATLSGLALQTAVKAKILERGEAYARAHAASADAANVLPVGALVQIT